MTDSSSDIKRSDILIRGLYMILFYAAGRITLALVFLLSFIQFVLNLAFKQINPQILEFSEKLDHYLHQVADFLTYATEQKPWPFSDWPSK